MNLDVTIKYIEDNKHENIQKLIALPHQKLNELKSYYYDWYKSAEEEGYSASAEVNFLLFQIIDQAIQIKNGNEEEIWDSLT